MKRRKKDDEATAKPSITDEQQLISARVRAEVDLHPAATRCPRAAIQGALNALVTRYSPALGGVVLAYRDAKLLGTSGVTLPYIPYIRVAVTAEFVLFTPRPKQYTVGKIVSIGVDHFSVLVVGVKGVITADKMKSGWKYEKSADDSEDDGSWIYTKQPGHSLRLGSIVRFYIDRVVDISRLDAGELEIRGSLTSGCGCTQFLEKRIKKGDRNLQAPI